MAENAKKNEEKQKNRNLQISLHIARADIVKLRIGKKLYLIG